MNVYALYVAADSPEDAATKVPERPGPQEFTQVIPAPVPADVARFLRLVAGALRSVRPREGKPSQFAVRPSDDLCDLLDGVALDCERNAERIDR